MISTGGLLMLDAQSSHSLSCQINTFPTTLAAGKYMILLLSINSCESILLYDQHFKQASPD